LTGNADR